VLYIRCQELAEVCCHYAVVSVDLLANVVLRVLCV
jgi:hypothetical protein